MCGFIAIYNKRNKLVEIDDERIRPLLTHRGPDDYQTYKSDCNKVGLYFFRLSILDLELGAQPIRSADGKITSVFNGEIYNFKELREDLVIKGVEFKTKGDSEVIPNLYNLYGKKFVEKLRGMFTIAIWDGEKLSVYRDRLGIKPLYYAEDEDRIIFSSEVRPLFKLLKISKAVSDVGLADYLRYGYVLSANSIYKDISTFPPATYLQLTESKRCFSTYWDISENTPLISNELDAVNTIDTKIDESIKHHLTSDVPVGIYLSGGLDSGVIAAKAVNFRKDITTYTLKFKEAPIDESGIAEEIAIKAGLKHKIIEVCSEDLLKLIGTSVWSMEQPLADSGTLANLFITKKVKEDGIKVVLCGAGGDEIFGGYTYHVKTDLEKIIGPVSLLVRIIGRLIGGEKGRKIVRTASFDSDPHGHYLDKTRVFHDLSSFREGLNSITDRKSQWFKKSKKDNLTDRLYSDLHTYIPANLMLLLDRATMLYSVEGRIPLLDHELVDLALKISPSIRHPNGERKGLLKKICRPLLPKSVFDLPKVGFNSPVAQWMDGELGEKVDKVLKSKKFLEREFWEKDKVEKVINSNLNYHQKWTLFQLEMFCRINVDNNFDSMDQFSIEDML